MIIKEKQSNVTDLIKLLPDFLGNPNPEIYLSDNYIVLDFETSNLGKGTPTNPDNKIVLSVWSVGREHNDYKGRGSNPHVSWGNEFELSELVDAIEKADYVVAHNTKFELGWLRRCGLDIDTTLPFCTQIAEYCIAGNRNWTLSLEDCLQRRGFGGKDNVVGKLIKAGVCPSEIPKRWLEQYCVIDTTKTERLFLAQRKLAVRNGLLPVMFTRNIFTTPLMGIERKGVHIDKGRAENVYTYYNKRKAALGQEFDELTGGANVKSGPQMRKVLYEDFGFDPPKDYRGEVIRTPKGEYSTSAKTMMKLKATTKEQKDFVRLKTELTKVTDAITKTLGKVVLCTTEREDNILFVQFNQTITGTHRLSSTGLEYKIQGQNIASEFKPLFSPRHKGWSIGEIDEAQLEYRIAVHLGRDGAGLQDIRAGADAHAFTASIIFKNEWESVKDYLTSPKRKKIRTNSKEHTFKPLYGGQSGTPRERKYYKAFRAKHKGVTETQEQWKREVLADGYLITSSGLRFYWPDTRITNSGYVINSTNICNYPVQSFATADIVPVAVAYQYHLMRVAEMESFLVNTVHDSSIGEVHPEEKELYEKIGVYCMVAKATEYCKQVFGIDLFAPLEAESEFKSHWSTSQEWEEKYNV